jgi:hypothetical protein
MKIRINILKLNWTRLKTLTRIEVCVYIELHGLFQGCSEVTSRLDVGGHEGKELKKETRGRQEQN